MTAAVFRLAAAPAGGRVRIDTREPLAGDRCPSAGNSQRITSLAGPSRPSPRRAVHSVACEAGTRSSNWTSRLFRTHLISLDDASTAEFVPETGEGGKGWVHFVGERAPRSFIRWLPNAYHEIVPLSAAPGDPFPARAPRAAPAVAPLALEKGVLLPTASSLAAIRSRFLHPSSRSAHGSAPQPGYRGRGSWFRGSEHRGFSFPPKEWQTLPLSQLGSLPRPAGIGGAGLAPLAALAKKRGWYVTGSDAQESPRVEELRRLGITVSVGHSKNNLFRCLSPIRTPVQRARPRMPPLQGPPPRAPPLVEGDGTRVPSGSPPRGPPRGTPPRSRPAPQARRV